MGAVALAQRGGILNSGVYPANRPNVDVAGAIGAVSQALTAQREGAIQRAYLQNQTARQATQDQRALEQELYERGIQEKQIAQQAAIAQAQRDLEEKRIDTENKTRQVLAQIAAESAAKRNEATIEGARIRAAGTVRAAGERAANSPNSEDAQGGKRLSAASLQYTKLLQHYMTPQKSQVNGINTPGMGFDDAAALARRAVRQAYPNEATKLWGAETGDTGAGPQTSTAAAEAASNAAYTQRYNSLDPKDPQYKTKKAALDQALMTHLNQIHSQPPVPLSTAPNTPYTQPSAGSLALPPNVMPTTMPSGSPDDDQEP